MNITQELIMRYKSQFGLKSDSELARHLKVTRATVSRWTNGNGHPEPVVAWKMAEDMGENPALLLVNIEAERANNVENAMVWTRLRNVYIMSTIAAHMRRKKLLFNRL